MSGGRERDSGVHERTINETSSEEEKDRQNPLDNIADVENEGNDNIQNPAVAADNPIANPLAGNQNNPASDDDDNDISKRLNCKETLATMYLRTKNPSS